MEKNYCYEYPRPALSIDAIVLRRGGQGVEVLLITRKAEPFKGGHSYPGGFFDVDEDESLEATVARELKEETGLEPADLEGEMELLGPYSAKGRDPRGRTVSIAYYGWAAEGAEPKAGDDAASLAWHPIDNLPQMAFDHADMMAHLRRKLDV